MNNEINQLSINFSNPVTVITLYRIKKGNEQEFERNLAEMTGTLGPHSGHFGIKVIRALDRTHPEYHLILNFISIEDYEQWCESTEYKQWHASIESLAESQPKVKKLEGVEAWINVPEKNTSHPSNHKMAVITYLSIFPLIVITSTLIGPILKPLSFLLRTMLSTMVVVITASYIVMPFMKTKIFARWLDQQPKTKEHHPHGNVVIPNPYTNVD